MGRLLLLLLIATALNPGIVHAQNRPPRLPLPQPRPLPLPPASLRPPPDPRIRISINGGAQLASHTVTQDFTLNINQDSASIINDIDLSGGGFVDFGVAYRIGRHVWTGASVSLQSRALTSQLSATVPHPFYFTFRQVSGTVTNLQNREIGIHGSIGYDVALTRSLDLLIFGGPSIFLVTQDLVTDIQYDSSYPFDVATLASTTAVATSGHAYGVNAGVDLSVKVGSSVSLGALVRFSQASGSLRAGADHAVDIAAGGLTAGGGIRLRF